MGHLNKNRFIPTLCGISEANIMNLALKNFVSSLSSKASVWSKEINEEIEHSIDILRIAVKIGIY